MYSVQSKLGEGAFAKIYRVVPKTGESKSDTGKVIKVGSFFLLESVTLFQFDRCVQLFIYSVLSIWEVFVCV